jgi:hypothetical protein
MTVDRRFSRRRLFAAMLAGAMLLVPGRFRWAAAAGEAADGKLARRMLAAVLGDPRRAHSIGRACLKALPETESSADSLMLALDADRMRALSASALRSLARTQVRRDFAEGAVISVEGWVLSATEVRIYALAALGGPAGA